MVRVMGRVLYIRNMVRYRRCELLSGRFVYNHHSAFAILLGLIAAGESPESSSIQRAITFILSKQNANGGWGENYLSCVNKEYTSEEEKQQGKASVSTLADGSSGVVQTAWVSHYKPSYSSLSKSTSRVGNFMSL